jgi:hypothetical protein
MSWMKNIVFVLGALLLALIAGGVVCACLLLIKMLAGAMIAGVFAVVVLISVSAFICHMITKGLEQ